MRERERENKEERKFVEMGGTRRSYTDAHLVLHHPLHINKIGSIIFEGSTEHISTR
jgi:hypothetical protein